MLTLFMLTGKPLRRYFKEHFEAWDFTIFVADGELKLYQGSSN